MAMTLRTDPELEAALTLLSEAEGLSRQEVTRRAVLDRARKLSRLRTVDALTQEALQEWAVTLDRLGRE
jgi:predicted transcriptional regulator